MASIARRKEGRLGRKVTPGDSIMPTMWITLEDELETILIKLMINK